MERIRKIYLPSTAITFMAVVVFVSIQNLLMGYENQSNLWILEVFGYIVFMEVMDVLICKVEFKSYLQYFLVEAVVGYVVLLFFLGYLGKWFSLEPGSLFQTTIIYLLIFQMKRHY